MKIYSVHEPQGTLPGSAELANDIVFVKEGISWPALFFPLLWQIFHGMWLALAVYLVIVVAIEFVLTYFGGDMLAGIGGICFALLFALEANNLRRWHLERKGYRMTSIVAGRNLEEAEFRFFDRWLQNGRRGTAPATPPVAPATVRPIAPVPMREEPIGVFPRPGGRA